MPSGAHLSETTRILQRLVSLPSVNPMGRPLRGPEINEYQVTAFLEDYFRTLGVPWERQTIAPQRDNIVARYEAAAAPRTLLFEAHQDTVPCDHMTIDPYGAVIAGGRLHGRGACDVKGGMAAMLTAFARLVRERPRGAASVIMACTVDEEHTFLGVRRLVETGLRADMAVVAEPTQLQIVNAHKGVVRWHLSTAGRSCHSSRPEQGINAIYRMGRLLLDIERFGERLRRERVDPLLGPASLSVGRIEGGASVNTVPDHCQIEIDRRLIPGEDALAAPAELLDFLHKAGIDFSCTCSEPWMANPPLSPAGSGAVVERLGNAIDAVQGSHQVIAVPYGTDAATIAAAGIPAVIFGPGDIGRAHTCDEWVPLDEVEAASSILFRMACPE